MRGNFGSHNPRRRPMNLPDRACLALVVKYVPTSPCDMEYIHRFHTVYSYSCMQNYGHSRHGFGPLDVLFTPLCSSGILLLHGFILFSFITSDLN